MILQIVALLLGAAGVVGCIIPAIPGPVLGFAGILCLWFTPSGPDGVELELTGVFTVVVSVLDYLMPAWFAARSGGSRWGERGALGGMILGMFLMGPLGVIAGPFLGAFLGEMLHDSRDARRALKVALSTFISFLLTTGLKLALCITLLWRMVAVHIWNFYIN